MPDQYRTVFYPAKIFETPERRPRTDVERILQNSGAKLEMLMWH